MNAMQPPQSIEEIKAGLETTEKGGVRQSIRNCLTVFQRDPLLSGAIAYNILSVFRNQSRFFLCFPEQQHIQQIFHLGLLL